MEAEKDNFVIFQIASITPHRKIQRTGFTEILCLYFMSKDTEETLR